MPTIFLIRHAEKPVGTIQGVNGQGTNDPDSLIPQGWQRAGALANFFGTGKALPAPDRIYASAPGKDKVAPDVKLGSKSQRPLETISPLAAKLNLPPILKFTKGNEQALASEIATLDGITLVCWQHEAIPQIATALPNSANGIPDPWPGDRFDVVWSLSRPDAAASWTFSQTCQQLLAGDGNTPIALQQP